MRNMKMRNWISGILALGLVMITMPEGLGAEKKFPTRPIQVIIPFVPGETDNQLRPFVDAMPEFLGQPMTMVYKPGASGAVGGGYVADAKPDGYTLLGASHSPVVLVPLTQKDAGYTWESFTPVGCVVEGTNVMVARSDAPWKNLQELVADAKKNPDKFTYTSPGFLHISHVAAEAFARSAGIKLNHVPSQGSSQAVTAILGGHVQIGSVGLIPCLPHIKAGTMRALAFFLKDRNPANPDVPTFLELGYPAVVRSVYGFFAPKGTPQEVVDILFGTVKKVMEKKGAAINQQLSQMGSQVTIMTPAEQGAMAKEQNEFFIKVLKGIQ